MPKNYAIITIANAHPETVPVTARFLGDATMANIVELCNRGIYRSWFDEGHSVRVEFNVTAPELLGQAV
jgi:hypothetical protein